MCDHIQDKDKCGRLVVKKYFVLHEEVIDFFHDKIYIPTIEKLSFDLDHARILGSMERGKTRIYCSRCITFKIYIQFKKNCEETFSKTTGIEIQGQQWGRISKLSMEDIDVGYFLNLSHPSSKEENMTFIHI